ncbi:hypothetical protein [Agromyces ramosus]|uniref:Bacteriophage HK97-gp10 tail-component n=1 Tax=Agromyces ramosus TaxID=33879 RepID=A0ABU0R9L9_9MICO|nr:hypothetical protein [Agromyces ramosus]MDQ0894427.1 hypothetical protein [Agromyces ramosus]
MADDEDLRVVLERVDEGIDELMPIALARGMEHIRGVAVTLTPERDGNLRAGAGVTVEGDEAQLTYPGPYARRQHYELTWKHTVGQALYLEQPMRTEADTALGIVADTLGGAFQ